MSLFDWFADRRKDTPISKERQERGIADDLWRKCPSCDALTYTKDLTTNFQVCPSCGHHNRIPSPQRLAQLIELDTWKPLNDRLSSADPLEFSARQPYTDRVRASQEKTQLQDAVITGIGHLRESSDRNSIPIVLGIMDFRFMGGSMGSVVGEKVTRAIERATAEHLPLVLVSASGGARMHEGILSLMQMAKTSAALDRHRAAGQLFISVLTHPTFGGVTASFAMLGDIILAEPKALIGFAGGRVIEQTIRQKLPEDFQTAEYLLEHGLIDAIVPRTKLCRRLNQLISLHQPRPTASNGTRPSGPHDRSSSIPFTAPPSPLN
ncbi:acetyl-CoA carboxylase, carboxyltransferase subunit beta [Synechococcus sp. PCC 7336]|uniref:acetyl-CoA carboxylase, carboxyltransferase subunit beta n=1 Tax=Synechococcus sp. PCC 7336 TaxID=195250 RepID=UPI00036AEA2D|nr:acetyl-CoA carboxylase, carboxyltransferase subunit beta [Synechococcus sp. PCC 7336]